MYIPSFKSMSQSMLKKSPENADGRTDGRTLPRHNTSRFSNGRIKTGDRIFMKFSGYVGDDTTKNLAVLFHACLGCSTVPNTRRGIMSVSNIIEKVD